MAKDRIPCKYSLNFGGICFKAGKQSVIANCEKCCEYVPVNGEKLEKIRKEERY